MCVCGCVCVLSVSVSLQLSPTIGLNVGELNTNGIKMVFWDLGGALCPIVLVFCHGDGVHDTDWVTLEFCFETCEEFS